MFEVFYDIYENKEKNEEIKKYLEDNPNPDQETLAMLLPYDTSFAKEYLKKSVFGLQLNTSIGIHSGT